MSIRLFQSRQQLLNEENDESSGWVRLDRWERCRLPLVKRFESTRRRRRLVCTA